MTVFAPDIIVTPHREPGRGQQTEPPRLVVEVRPPTALIDLAKKVAAYTTFGVQSYWVIVSDTRQPELIAFDATGGHCEEATTVKGNEVSGPARQPFPLEVSPGRLVAGLGPAMPLILGLRLRPVAGPRVGIAERAKP